MTIELFRDDSYIRECDAIVVSISESGVELDQTVFYPLGGGQPGDSGSMSWADGRFTITDTRYDSDGCIRHQYEDDAPPPAVGEQVHVTLDWERRYRHMRMHTAMHLLGSVLHYGVTGGNISSQKSRLDFDMEETVDKEAVSEAMRGLVHGDHPIRCRWITDEELGAQPELVRTMSVQPPSGKGRIRLLEIEGVDLQPCGGTHLKSSAEVGKVRIGKVEKKGKRNRRVNIHLDD